jgi:hypothetical protein
MVAATHTGVHLEKNAKRAHRAARPYSQLAVDKQGI